MPNKKINQLDSRVLSSTDLLLIGDPVSGVSYKSLVSGLGLVYVPYTGATGNIALGEYGISGGYFQADLTPTMTAGVGRLIWNDTDGTLNLGLKGGSVTLHIGQNQYTRVVNGTGGAVTKAAYRAVKVTGAQGQRLQVNLAQANNDANSTDTLGVIAEDIANNQEGFICTSGQITGLNTTGSLQGETWADGDILYLSPTTPGVLTKVKPTAPNHSVIMGFVVYAHANNGKIFLKVDNGYESSELHDIYTPTKNENDSIFWVTANNRYESKSVAQALGYTPVPTTRTLTINGTAYDLSADRSWTVSVGGTTIYSGDGTLAGDRTVTSNGNSLTILGGKEEYAGSPVSLRLQGDTTNKSPHFSIKNTNASGFDYTLRSLTDGNFELINYTTLTTILKIKSQYFQIRSSANSFLFGVESNTLPGLWIGVDAGSQTLTNSTLLKNGTDTILSSNSLVRFYNGSNDTGRIIASTGNWIIQTGGTFTDSGHKLQVNGTARVSGKLYSTGGIDSLTAPILAYDGGAANSRAGLGISSGTLNVFGPNNLLLGVLKDQSTMTTSNANIWLSNGLTQVNTVFDASSYKYIYAPVSISSAITASFGAARFHNTYNASTTTYTQYPILSITRAGESGVGYDMSASFGIRRRIVGGNTPKTTLDLNVGETAINGYPDVTIMTISATGVGINNTTPNTSAMLDVASTTQGFLPPRMTTTQKNAISSPAAGLVVYDTTTNKLCCYNGSTWNDLF